MFRRGGPVVGKTAVCKSASLCLFHINKLYVLLRKLLHVDIRLILGNIHADDVTVFDDPPVDLQFSGLYGQKQNCQHACRSCDHDKHL